MQISNFETQSAWKKSGGQIITSNWNIIVNCGPYVRKSLRNKFGYYIDKYKTVQKMRNYRKVALDRKYDKQFFLSLMKENCFFLNLHTCYLDEDNAPRFAQNRVLLKLFWQYVFTTNTA